MPVYPKHDGKDPVAYLDKCLHDFKQGRAIWLDTGVGLTEGTPILKEVSPFFEDKLTVNTIQC